MPLLARVLIILILLPIIAFCVFGFLATFEPPGYIGMRIAYAAIGVLALAGAAYCLLAHSRRSKPN